MTIWLPLQSDTIHFSHFFSVFWQFTKHSPKLAHVPPSSARKKAKLLIKAKRDQVKVHDNQPRLSSEMQGGREGGRRWGKEEGRENWRWRGEEDYTGRIRTKAFLAPVETLMRVQIHYWLINHDTLWHRGGDEGRGCCEGREGRIRADGEGAVNSASGKGKEVCIWIGMQRIV